MSRIGIFMADGCEMIEALTVVDIVRRAGLSIDTISINKTTAVTSSHKVTFLSDITTAEMDPDAYDALVIPGGVPGVPNLGADPVVAEAIRKFAAEGKILAAICAGPTVLGQAGLLDGKHATCHPGWEPKMGQAILETDTVVKDQNVITSRGMGTSIPFAFEIVRCFCGEDIIDGIKKGIVYTA